MKMIKMGDRYFEILHQSHTKKDGSKYETNYILKDGDTLYFTLFRNSFNYWEEMLTITQLRERIEEVKNTKWRNQMLKDYTLEVLNDSLSKMVDFNRDLKIDKLFQKEFIWQFA
jgi:hypothetical protein